MLILTRNPGDSILIGDNIVVKYIGPNSRHGKHDTKQISIGIEAPDDTKILREELSAGRRKP